VTSRSGIGHRSASGAAGCQGRQHVNGGRNGSGDGQSALSWSRWSPGVLERPGAGRRACMAGKTEGLRGSFYIARDWLLNIEDTGCGRGDDTTDSRTIQGRPKDDPRTTQGRPKEDLRKPIRPKSTTHCRIGQDGELDAARMGNWIGIRWSWAAVAYPFGLGTVRVYLCEPWRSSLRLEVDQALFHLLQALTLGGSVLLFLLLIGGACGNAAWACCRL
jgi:hypothetical protein